MSIKKSGVLKLKAQRLMVFAALGLTTAIGNVYADDDDGCPYSTSEFMQGMFAGNDGSFAMKNIKKAGDVTIKGEKYTVNVNDPNFDANLGYLDQFRAVQASFDEVRGRGHNFDNNKAVKYFAIECDRNNVKFTVKASEIKQTLPEAIKFDFILTKAGDQHQQGGQQPGDMPPPPQDANIIEGPQEGDITIVGKDKLQYIKGRWVRIGRA